MCMLKFRENEDAVSPVIGVILMVAITVILAAVIAAFVFGMAGGVDTQPRIVAATAQLSGDYIVVTYQGGQDHADVMSVECIVVEAGEAADGASLVEGGSIIKKDDDDSSSLKVGHKWSVDVSSLRTDGAEVLVTVSAKFEDGTEQVILDKNIRVPKSDATNT